MADINQIITLGIGTPSGITFFILDGISANPGVSSEGLRIEMNLGESILDTEGLEILDTAGNNILDMGWIDVQDDVLTNTPTVIFQGQRNGDAVDRVADAGTIKLVMNNSADNSAGLVGYYSPDHASKRDSFGIGTRVRIGITKDSVTEWLSQGRVIDLKMAAGLLSSKTVNVTCGDWMEVASRTPMPRIPVQESVTDDQVIQTIVDALDDAPNETDLAAGAYTYDYALTDVEDEETPILTVLQRLAQCGLARIFITGGTTSGEVLTYVDLYSLLTTGTPVASFVDDFINMEASRRAFKRVKRVVATGYPNSKDVSPVVLYTLISEIMIPAGTEIDLVGYYRDPNANSSRTIAAVDIVTPVVNTDYKFSSVSGTGTDMNSDLSIETFEDGAKSFYIRVKNNNITTNGYLWFFQVRGQGLYPYDAISYTAVDSTIREGEGITINYDLPYIGDYNEIKEIATALLEWYSVEVSSAPTIDFCPTLSDDDYDKMLACKPGTLITTSDTVTGISYTMIVLGREISIWNGGAYITERLFVTPAQQVESGLYFMLDTLGQDDLDGVNTILAFG